MLTEKELMIGDWVMYNPNVFIDDEYETAKEWFPTQINSGEDIDLAIEGCYDSIPLTPEILEKIGFVANKHVYPYPYYEYINEKDKLKVGFAFPRGNRTSYKEPWVYIDSEYVFVEHLPCIYVHQLQHILRLCGIKKEVEL